MAKKKDTSPVPSSPADRRPGSGKLTPDKGFNLDGAQYKHSDTGKGAWKPLGVSMSPVAADANTDDKPGSDNKPETVKLVEPFMPSTPKRPGEGIGGRKPNQGGPKAADAARADNPVAVQVPGKNPWYGPGTVATGPFPEAPNPQWKGTYGGYDGKLGNIPDEVTGAGDDNAVIDSSPSTGIPNIT